MVAVKATSPELLVEPEPRQWWTRSLVQLSHLLCQSCLSQFPPQYPFLSVPWGQTRDHQPLSSFPVWTHWLNLSLILTTAYFFVQHAGAGSRVWPAETHGAIGSILKLLGVCKLPPLHLGPSVSLPAHVLTQQTGASLQAASEQSHQGFPTFIFLQVSLAHPLKARGLPGYQGISLTTAAASDFLL